jgi:hypothetical protein
MLRRPRRYHHCQYIGHARHTCRSKSPPRILDDTKAKRIRELEKDLNDSINTCAWEEKRRVHIENELTYLRNLNSMKPSHVLNEHMSPLLSMMTPHWKWTRMKLGPHLPQYPYKQKRTILMLMCQL